MKTMPAILVLLFAFVTHAQDTWPRNPQTGKVEFRGTLPWPATAKTEAQRRALVRRWYLSKLTNESAAAVEQVAHTVVSPSLLTYAGLPVAAIMGSSKGPILSYSLNLKPVAHGLAYTFNEFYFSQNLSDSLGPNLEQVLATDSVADRPALSALRQRLSTALARW